MKNNVFCIVSIILLICSNNAFSQFELPKKLKSFQIAAFRASLEIGKASRIKNMTAGGSFAFIAENGWRLGADARTLNYKSQFLPFNFSGGSIPKDKMESLCFLVGKSYGSRERRFRISGELGISKLNFSQANYKANPYNPINPNGGFITFLDIITSIGDSSHEVTYKQQKGFGMRMKARFDLPLSNYFGIGVSGYTDLNKIRTFSGAAINLNIGLL